MVLCWGSELFSGLRFVTRVHFCMCFHHTNFVCGSAIQVGIAIAVHRCIAYTVYSTNMHVYIYCWISVRELVRRLVGSMVSS